MSSHNSTFICRQIQDLFKYLIMPKSLKYYTLSCLIHVFATLLDFFPTAGPTTWHPQPEGQVDLAHDFRGLSSWTAGSKHHQSVNMEAQVGCEEIVTDRNALGTYTIQTSHLNEPPTRGSTSGLLIP